MTIDNKSLNEIFKDAYRNVSADDLFGPDYTDVLARMKPKQRAPFNAWHAFKLRYFPAWLLRIFPARLRVGSISLPIGFGRPD